MKFPVRKLWVGFCLLGIASAALAQTVQSRFHRAENRR